MINILNDVIGVIDSYYFCWVFELSLCYNREMSWIVIYKIMSCYVLNMGVGDSNILEVFLFWCIVFCLVVCE